MEKKEGEREGGGREEEAKGGDATRGQEITSLTRGDGGHHPRSQLAVPAGGNE